MAVLQSKQTELRYLKRKNLESESKIIGNYYRDIIRSYGVDCTYYKLNTSIFENYNGIVTQNSILKHAYGYSYEPDYHLSVNMLTYLEVENDIFQLQKYGLNPNTDVTFYFDSVDFASDLAIKSGQYKEYKITDTTISVDVTEKFLNKETPLSIGLDGDLQYTCELMTGFISCEIENIDFNNINTVMCDTFKHTDMIIEFPVNKFLYKSFMHKIKNDKYLDTAIFLKYTFEEKDNHIFLVGNVTGTVLFFDIHKIGKYLDLIHPDVGDIIIIDFPDEKNREQYEITDCFDRQLTQDGINPLLHKYVWKCKARRHIKSYENPIDVQNEGTDRKDEKIALEEISRDYITEQIQLYPDNEDAVYGGYERIDDVSYDKEQETMSDENNFIRLEENMMMNIITFGIGTRLVTDGYDLFFIDKNEKISKLTLSETNNKKVKKAYFETDLRFLKSSPDMLVFVNIEGTSFKLVENRLATQDELQFCLNSLFDKTVDHDNINKDGNNFYIFKESKTTIFSTETNLFVRLSSNKKIYKMI